MDPLPACCSPSPDSALSSAQAEELALVLRALSEPVRLRLISILSQVDERCVCDLVEPLGVSQPTVSHHLKVLADAGLVDRRKAGRWMMYRLNREALGAVASAISP